ncbi:MAG: hypothetical protein AABW49_01105 [Nanoarchaeota archaeon]
MKLPKTKKMYCKHCKHHTTFSVAQAKKRERGTLKKGSMLRLKKRGSGLAGYGNKGRYSRKPITQYKRTGAKLSKKVDLRFKCNTCNKTMVQSKGLRIKKPVFE